MPSVVGLPNRIQSSTHQTMPAIAPAVCVFMNAVMARPSAPSALPALKPYQPNQSIAAPSTAIGRLCGGEIPSGKPCRLPSTITAASADMPALMCTTMPPAKSTAPMPPSVPRKPPQVSTPVVVGVAVVEETSPVVDALVVGAPLVVEPPSEPPSVSVALPAGSSPRQAVRVKQARRKVQARRDERCTVGAPSSAGIMRRRLAVCPGRARARGPSRRSAGRSQGRAPRGGR